MNRIVSVRHLGLQLATLGEDGICRIYEAVRRRKRSDDPRFTVVVVVRLT